MNRQPKPAGVRNSGFGNWSPTTLVLLAFALVTPHLHAKPRPPFPPLPELPPVLWQERFDQPLRQNATNAQVLISPVGIFVESFSGYALQRSGTVPSFTVPTIGARGRTNITQTAGSIRFWFNSYWSTSAGGPGSPALLLETTPEGDGSIALFIVPDGSAVCLVRQTTSGAQILLQSQIVFEAGEWHMFALNYTPSGLTLFIDGVFVAGYLAPFGGLSATALVIGSNLGGTQAAEGEFEELSSFAQPLSADSVAAYYNALSNLAAMGPLTAEEQQARRLTSSATAQTANVDDKAQAERSSLLASAGSCASELAIVRSADGKSVTVTIQNGVEGTTYDIFRTLELKGTPASDSDWRWMAKGLNGQSFTFRNPGACQGFFIAACDQDTDADGLTDAFEQLISKTDPNDAETFGQPDVDWYFASNILVNDPADDCGNAQNTQFESTVAVSGNNVIVAYVDANRSVFNFNVGSPRTVGYSVSTDGGLTFIDMDVPPLDTLGEGLGDAGDPVLATDRASSGVVYLTGTSPRQIYLDNSVYGQKGVPFWRSTDGGITFQRQPTVHDEIRSSDHPWITVDDYVGTGQHDVYIACTGIRNDTSGERIWLFISKDGGGTDWSDPAKALSEEIAIHVHSAIVVTDAEHAAYVVWFELRAEPPESENYVNYLKMRKISSRGMTLWPETQAKTIRELISTDYHNGDLHLKRSNSAASDDTFYAFPFPVVAANPSTSKAGHLYVAYADKGSGSDKADIYFTYSTDGGANWSSSARVNADTTINDQWMPVMCVKPDGTKLLIAWYDRRNDSGNSMIDFYGRWGTIATDGTVSFGIEFQINTVSFPPVFAGTLPNNRIRGAYDPLYPPNGVTLHWWYPNWSPVDYTSSGFPSHVGEYNGAWPDDSHVYVTWTDSRLPSKGSVFGDIREDLDVPENWQTIELVGSQRDVRAVRLSWP
jgi:hypothetical protein